MQYEVASMVTIFPSDIEKLKVNNTTSQWLAQQSELWLGFWLDELEAKVFFPFDSLVIAYVIDNKLFHCEKLAASIQRKWSFFCTSRDDLIVPNENKCGRIVRYCYDIEPALKSILISRL